VSFMIRIVRGWSGSIAQIGHGWIGVSKILLLLPVELL
jgi:hypothetical protein